MEQLALHTRQAPRRRKAAAGARWRQWWHGSGRRRALLIGGAAVLGVLVIVLVALGALGVLHGASTPPPPPPPPHSRPPPPPSSALHRKLLFASKQATAVTSVLCYNASASSKLAPDSEGWGGVAAAYRQPLYTEDGFVGRQLLQPLVADPRVGAIQLEAPPPQPSAALLAAFLDTAAFALQHDTAVLVIGASQKAQSQGPGGVAAALAYAEAVRRYVGLGTEAAAHVGVSLDLESPQGAPDWAAIARALPPRARDGGPLHILAIVSKAAPSQQGFEALLPAADAIGLMFYASMTPSVALDRFQNNLHGAAALLPSGKTVLQGAAEAGTAVVVGIETTWMGKAPSEKDYKVICAVVAESSFVMGGGVPPQSTLRDFLASPAAQSHFDVAPAARWSGGAPQFLFMVEELRTMQQLDANLASPPPCWPAVDADKCALQSACASQFAGSAAQAGPCPASGQYPPCGT